MLDFCHRSVGYDVGCVYSSMPHSYHNVLHLIGHVQWQESYENTDVH